MEIDTITEITATDINVSSSCLPMTAIEDNVEFSGEEGMQRLNEKEEGKGLNLGIKQIESSMMGVVSWHAVKETQPKILDDSKKLVDCSSDVVPPPKVQGSIRPWKSSGFGSGNRFNKHQQLYHQKPGFKRNIPSNALPSYLIPYQQPPAPPVFNTVVPPYLPVQEYAYQPFPGQFPNAQFHTPECSGPTQPYIPSGGLGGGIDAAFASTPFLPPLRGGPWSHAYMQEPGGHFYHTGGYQRPFNPRDNFSMPQFNGLRAFAGPAPPFFGSAPGCLNEADCFFDAGHPPMCYNNHYIPHPIQHRLPVPPETLALMVKIVRQIEYYFSDENLPGDKHLLSLLDAQGWVSISKIADFNRVKKLTTNIPLIMDALRSSSSIELQGDMLRRRGDWSKFLPIRREKDAPSANFLTQKGQVDEKVTLAVEGDGFDQANTTVISEERRENPTSSEGQVEVLPSQRDTSIKAPASNSQRNLEQLPPAEEPQTSNEETVNFIRTYGSESSSEINLSDLCGGYSCLHEKDSVDCVCDYRSSGSGCCVRSQCSQGTTNPSKSADPEFGNIVDLTSFMNSLCCSSNDSANEASELSGEQSNFLIEEEP